MERLVSLSVAKAGRLYGVVYPRDVWWVRLALTVENLIRQLHGSSFRAFVHPPRAIIALIRRAGLEPNVARRTFTWEVVVCHRPSGGSDPVADRAPSRAGVR
jgi:hypothetical protein